MIRKLAAALAVLLCVSGLALVASPAQAKGVLPVTGEYTGFDHHGRTITLKFNGSTVTHFKVNGRLIGDSRSGHTAHVSGGMWHETCHNGWCTKGSWLTDFHVVGWWRDDRGNWTSFEATAPEPPRQGDFMGQDHQGNPVDFTITGTKVHNFRINGHAVFADAFISNGHWTEVCSSHDFCFRGHYESSTMLSGEWRTRGSVWHSWEAYAFAYSSSGRSGTNR